MPDAVAVREGTSFVAALEAANLHPLWDRFRKLTPVKPQAKDAPMHWRWRDIAPFADRAVSEVPIDDVERRAIILVNPAFGGETVTTSNLIAAFTVLDPGDRARPHRHTFAAIRFATRAEGAATIVNGRRLDMRAGDLILTPPMCWHGHINESDHRIIWFDAANIPLIRDLDANFFEPGDPQVNDFWQVDAGEEPLWAAPGLVGADLPAALAHSPKYHYAGEATRRMLAALPPGPNGARNLRYVNPATGGPVMPALDCHAARLPKGVATRPRRTTCNLICLVVSGQGRSVIGEQMFEWSEHDVFTVPHWTYATHTALDGEADLFVVSDKAAFEHLGLYREELQ
jgi:gentisate 1,2-dioxygenase